MGRVRVMDKPPLTQAPLQWLETVVNDSSEDTDEEAFDINISAGTDHEIFTYLLGDIRTELKRRQD